jgi:hypothetical protein
MASLNCAQSGWRSDRLPTHRGVKVLGPLALSFRRSATAARVSVDREASSKMFDFAPARAYFLARCSR